MTRLKQEHHRRRKYRRNQSPVVARLSQKPSFWTPGKRSLVLYGLLAFGTVLLLWDLLPSTLSVIGAVIVVSAGWTGAAAAVRYAKHTWDNRVKVIHIEREAPPVQHHPPFESEKKQLDNLQSLTRHLYQEKKNLTQQVEELATLREIALAINSILDFPNLLSAILETVGGVMEAQTLAVYLPNKEGALIPRMARIQNEVLEDPNASVLPFEANQIESAESERRTVLGLSLDGNTCLISPLFAKSQLVGVLAIESIRSQSFDEEDRLFLQTLSSQIALALANAHLYEMAVTDDLTGLTLKRHFNARLREEVERAWRYGQPLALIMLDLDHFKRVNDTYGHPVGDKVLKAIAQRIKDIARSVDIAARYGGEEMALLLPHTDAKGALILAERLREAISAESIPISDHMVLGVTASLGVALLGDSIDTPEKLIEHADQALYRAKGEGRNRVEMWGTADAAALLAKS